MMKVIVILLSMLIIPWMLFGETVELNPTQDTQVIESEPDTNYGSWDYMNVGYGGGIETLIQFDISPYINDTLNIAYLKLDFYITNYSPYYYIYLYRTSSSWDEGTVTWNTRPSYDNSIWKSFRLPENHGWKTINVTSLVKTWLDESFTNNGFLMRGGYWGVGGVVYTKEFDYPSVHPILELDYIPDIIHSKSLGSIKSLFE